MTTFKIFLLSFVLILAASVVIAQEETPSTTVTQAINLDEDIRPADLGVGKPRILPNSPFYFIKVVTRGIQYTFTFNPIAKAELSLKFANEKLMEAKFLTEKKPELIPAALENYKMETDQLKTAVEKIPLGAIQSPEVDKFMDKFVDNNLKQQKLFGKLEKELPSETHESIEKAKDENTAKFSDIGLKLVSPEVLQEKITETTETQPGSNFKQFKNLEVLQQVAEKVPQTAKPAIQQAIENSFNKLKGDLEQMSPQNQEQFKDYVQNIGGNETRHLAIIDAFERAELSQIVREEIEKAKQKILERVEIRLKEYTTKQMETTQKEYLSHLSEQGQIEDLRVIKEMENNLSSQVMQPVLAAKQVATTKVIETLEKAETPDQQKGLFEKIENKYYDVQQLEVFKEIDELIPPEKRELYEKLKERALTKMKEEVERAKTMTTTEEKLVVLNTMAGNSPEHIKVLEELKAQPKETVPIKPPQEMIQQTVERIERKVEITQDPAKTEILKNKLEEKEVKKVVEQIKPEVIQKVEEKSETISRTMTLERAQWEINYAKSQIAETEKASGMFLPELRAELDKTNYQPLMDTAKKHLAKAEKAFADGNFGEAFGQATAALQNASNAQETRLKTIEQKAKLEERNEKWRKFVFEVSEKIPGLIPPSALAEKGLSLSVNILLNCSIPSLVPSPQDCDGKWAFKSDNRGCLYFECVGAAKELPCANEGQKLNRDPKMGLTNQQCCTGLVEVKTSTSYSYCQKPGPEGALECKGDFDCPQPLCSGVSSKCDKGKCIVPMCVQPPLKPTEPKIICAQVTTLAINPENTKCIKFPTPCDVPVGWKQVGECPKIVTCCAEGVCKQVPFGEKCEVAAPEKPVCIQVITPAVGPDGTCKEFPTPCDVPTGWKSVDKCRECYTGEERRYTCPDGLTTVDWCKCSSEERMVCIVSPEKACIPTKTEVSLHPYTPSSNSRLIRGTKNEFFTSIKFSATSQPYTVSQIVVSRGGVSADTDLTIIGLSTTKIQLGTTKTLDPTTHKAIFSGLSFTVPANSSKVLDIWADVSSTATVGNTIALGIVSLSDITSTIALEGRLPIWGNTMTIAPECSSGERKQYKCPDGINIVEWCKCSAQGQWDCIASPEKSCPTTTPIIDKTPPIISDVAATDITRDSAIIAWKTDELSTSQLWWGRNETYGAGLSSDVYLTYHTISLKGLLLPGTTYHYKVFSKDPSGNGAFSPDYTFSTLEGPKCTDSDSGEDFYKYGEVTDIYGKVYKDVCSADSTSVTEYVCQTDGLTMSKVYRCSSEGKVCSGGACVADTTSPVISDLTARDITSSAAKIEWQTNESATSEVIFGTTDIYHTGSEKKTALDTSLVTYHSVPLTFLEANTLYHYRVESKDAAGNLAVSGSASFTTSAQTQTQKSLTVTYPNGGETWIMGKTYDILWKSSGVEKVNIEVNVFKDGTSVGTLSIAGSDLITLASAGKYSWTPNSQHLKEGNQFKIVIRDTASTTTEDESDAYFSITE